MAATTSTSSRPHARPKAGRLDRDGGKPLYRQLSDDLRERLAAGEWNEHKPLPSEAKISEMWSVSPYVVRQAMGLLVQEGLLVRERGRGTFVRPTSSATEVMPGAVRHHRIALVMPWDRGSFFAALFPGVEEPAHNAGFRTMLVNSWDDPEIELDRIRETVDHGVDGLIWMCVGDGPKPTAVRYAREKTPALVMIDRVPPSCRGEVSLVDADNRGGMALAVRHLLDRGHRRIAFARSQRHFSSTKSRERGYRETMKKAGIDVPDAWVFGTRRVGQAGGEVLARKILKSGERFDAVCCSSDPIAVGLIHTFQEHGLRVPEDVAVTGFDDDPMCTAVRPMLTTVQMDLRTIALEATRLLFDQLTRQAQQQVISVTHVSVPVKLVVRESA